MRFSAHHNKSIVDCSFKVNLGFFTLKLYVVTKKSCTHNIWSLEYMTLLVRTQNMKVHHVPFGKQTTETNIGKYNSVNVHNLRNAELH